MKSSDYDKQIVKLLVNRAKAAREASQNIKSEAKYEMLVYKHKCYSEALRLIRSIEPLEARGLEKKKEVPKFYVNNIKPPVFMDFS